MLIKQMLCGDKWEFRDVTQDNWYPGNVPGTLFSDMMACGQIKDPYYRFNEREIWPLADNDYEYRLEFSVSTDVIGKKNQILVFEGIDTLAQIWLNGEMLADTENMHRTYRIPVAGKLGKKNELLVRLSSPTRYIKARHEEDPVSVFNCATINGFSQLRKWHSAFGWDAEPQIPDFGLWRDVYIEAYDNSKLDNVYVRQTHNGGAVSLDIEVELLSQFPTEHKVTVTLEGPDGVKQEEAITSEDLKVTIPVEVKNPQIWWPNGYGEQPLYNVNVVVSHNSQTIDSQNFNIGLRTFEVRREKDEAGESFMIVVNRVPIFAKGGNYTPPDKFISHSRGERHERLVKDCVEANYNCIRIWGGAVYPDSELFELCDKYGLIVWQDFMFACALYHVDDAFIEDIRAEAKDNIIRLRNHACLALWCGNNENEWFHAYDNDLPYLTMERRLANMKLYEMVLKDAVDTYDPEKFYWPSSPSSGGGYHEPNGFAAGDVHFWNVWYLPARPYTHYRDCTGRFISEFGLESFQDIKTLRNYMEPEDMSPNSAVMDFMQRCSDKFSNIGNAKILSYVFQEVKVPKDFEEYIFATQYAQAEGIKFGICHWRRLMPHCMGTLYWQIVDCFPGTSWSSIDYEYRWKMLHYYAKRFFSQVMISAEDNNFKVRVNDDVDFVVKLVVASDRTEAFDGTVIWSLRDSSSNVIMEGKTSTVINPLVSETIVTLDLKDQIKFENKRERYLAFSIVDEDGTVLSEDTHLFVKPKHFEFRKPKITLEASENDDAFEIKVNSDCYAKCVRLDLSDDDCHFSDNCFDLNGNVTKSIFIKKESLSKPISLKELKTQLFVQTLNEIGV